MATFSDRPNRIGKYEILSTIGRGGMGVVYKARDPKIDRVVAIKTILIGADAGAGEDNLLDRLAMEARSAGRLQHPNIVTVYDFGEEDGLSYIVMEFVEGINLASLIDEKRALPLGTKLSILLQIADGLSYAHEHGVVHRDMKPSNVCVTARGNAKILDFGLARFDSTRLTKTGFMAGTIAYMSPERLNGTTGPKDDIFALGAIAYELLTFQRAFPGGTPPEVIGKIIAPDRPRDPSTLSAIPVELDPIVQKALAKDIEERYESAAAFADDLRQFMRSDAFQDFLDAEDHPTLDRSIKQLVDVTSGNVYAGPSSRNQKADTPPTLGSISKLQTAIVPDVKTTGSHTQPDVSLDTVSAAATQVLPSQPPRRRRVGLLITAAAIVVAIAGALIVSRRPTPVNQGPPKTVTAALPTTTNSTSPLAEQSELLLTTARGLSQELDRRKLNRPEMVKFTEAKARIALGEKKLQAKDYEGGSHLIADAITSLQAVMSANDERQRGPVTVTAQPAPPKPQPRGPAKQPTVATSSQPTTQTSAPPVVENRPAPVPQAQPQPPAQPPPHPAPAIESPEKEIGAFMRLLAAAYQNKDIAFFREHTTRFTDQLANAIRNSPSVRVELQLSRIDVTDAQHAIAHVKRTDWFGDRGAPAAVQSLAYALERDSGGWKIASISRE
ncbi:MAG TPA: serine/threonine-protein kinase [Thermoanaerobaculia bacterium]|nr:serine/threonine-protein kinase [Thermoanaerobaculia bacterium]